MTNGKILPTDNAVVASGEIEQIQGLLEVHGFWASIDIRNIKDFKNYIKYFVPYINGTKQSAESYKIIDYICIPKGCPGAGKYIIFVDRDSKRSIPAVLFPGGVEGRRYIKI